MLSKNIKSFKNLSKQVQQFSTSQYYMDLEAEYGCHNYAPLPVVLAKGKGVHVWDVEGNQYLDFQAGIGAVNQGHLHPKIRETFLKQSENLTLLSRAFYSDQLGITEEFLHKTFGYDKSVLMNTGYEGVDTAVKYARRWAYEVKGVPQDRARVLFPRGNFWGRGIAACGSSDDPLRFRNFGPFHLNFDQVEYNNIQALEQQLDANPNYAAVVMESIQGEKGVIIPDAGYIQAVKAACEKRNVLFVIDEVQTGVGRTGKLLNHYWEDVRPDMVVLGKALSGGFYPVSAVLADNHIMDNIKPGEHGSTYGGNPMAAALAKTAVEVVIEERLAENSLAMGDRLMSGLKQLNKSYIEEIRGRGLFIAIQLNPEQSGFTAMELCLKMKDLGLVVRPSNDRLVKLSPPLVINEQQVDQAIDIFARAMQALEK